MKNKITYLRKVFKILILAGFILLFTGVLLDLSETSNYWSKLLTLPLTLFGSALIFVSTLFYHNLKTIKMQQEKDYNNTKLAKLRRSIIAVILIIGMILTIGGVIFLSYEDKEWAKIMFFTVVTFCIAGWIQTIFIYFKYLYDKDKTKHSTHNNCVDPSVQSISNSNEIKVEELLSSSPLFSDAYKYTRRLKTNDIFKLFDELDYESNGFPAIMLHKMCRNDYWEATLRNVSDWKEPSLDCKGETAHKAICLMYAWCVHKNYLPHPKK